MRTLFLSDLDGTLIRSDERISEYTSNVINGLVRAGGLFSYATARSLVTAAKVTAGLNAVFPVICYNGAFIIENATEKILLAQLFTPEEAGIIRQTLTAYGVFPIVYAYIEGKECFSFLERNLSPGMRFFLDSRLGDPRSRKVQNEDQLYCGDMFYFTCISNEQELSPIQAAFTTSDRVQCIYQKDIYSDAQWCELIPTQATKANAALKLKTMLGCDRLVAFGDARNDLSLFSVADECYAMANAVPELKAIATGVIGSNDDDGVAKWLEANAL